MPENYRSTLVILYAHAPQCAGVFSYAPALGSQIGKQSNYCLALKQGQRGADTIAPPPPDTLRNVLAFGVRIVGPIIQHQGVGT